MRLSQYRLSVLVLESVMASIGRYMPLLAQLVLAISDQTYRALIVGGAQTGAQTLSSATWVA